MFFYGIINKTGENMPRKKPDLLDIEEAKTKLNITLQHSNLSGEKDADVMYGTIRCKKCQFVQFCMKWRKIIQQL